MKSIVAFSQCFIIRMCELVPCLFCATVPDSSTALYRKFIMGVNLRLIRTKLEEERESLYEILRRSSFPGERVLCRSASLIVVIARK